MANQLNFTIFEKRIFLPIPYYITVNQKQECGSILKIWNTFNLECVMLKVDRQSYRKQTFPSPLSGLTDPSKLLLWTYKHDSSKTVQPIRTPAIWY